MYNDKWESQVRKGILEFILLLILKDRKYYGYELTKEIKNRISMDISEGTVYPLLNRLKKEELISSQWIEYDSGVPRKYYSITDKGKETVSDMKDFWFLLISSVQKMIDKS